MAGCFFVFSQLNEANCGPVGSQEEAYQPVLNIEKQEITTNSLTEKLLPRALSVTECINAREFEINAMETALANARSFLLI